MAEDKDTYLMTEINWDEGINKYEQPCKTVDCNLLNMSQLRRRFI